MRPKIVVLHHSLTADNSSASWGAITKWHMGLIGQGNPNIPNYNYYVNHPMKNNGYNVGIELIGDKYEILLGRMLNEQGAHVAGHNSESLGVCWVGNYDLSEPPLEMWNLGIKLVTSLCNIFGISPSNIYGHNHFNPQKTCPGKMFNVEGFKLQVFDRL